MKHTLARRLLGLCLALSLGAAAFAQGVYWESKMTGGPMGDQPSQMYYMPKMFKHVSGNNGQIMILRLDKEMMYTIDPKEKTYSKTTFTEFEEMMKKNSSQMDDRKAKLQEKLKNMPEAQRKMIESMMPGKAEDAKVEVTNSGEKSTLSGYACTKYVVTQDGKDFMTLWVTKDIKEFDAMKADFEEYSKRMSAMNPMMGKGYLEAMKKIDGHAVQTDIAGFSMLVTKVEKRATPKSEFEVPAGYKEVKPKWMEQEGKQ